MTIAMCYVSPEGIVFGADSTSTFGGRDGNHYFNHAQKLFEVGSGSTLGIVTWGLGGLGAQSYRTLIASLSDDLLAHPPANVEEVAQRWADLFWKEYTSQLLDSLKRCNELAAKPQHGSGQPSAERTEAEEHEFTKLRWGLVVGFCVGGYVKPDRTPLAYQVVFDPISGRPQPLQLPLGSRWFGAPNMIKRLIMGCDEELRGTILNSGKWNGTAADLDQLIGKHTLSHPLIPIREAIDFVHTCILSTIKALKFSSLSQICGGPIELAVITTDRDFRWVRHKSWDAAITGGDL